MKKLVAIFMALCVLICAAAAEAPVETSPIEDVPAPRSQDAQADSISITIEGRPLLLSFDPSPQYSSITDGMVQASFYAYSDDGKTLYELYMVFPEAARTGDVVTPEDSSTRSEESSVVLIVSDMDTQNEKYFFCSVMGGEVYPEYSGFSIRLDSVTESGNDVCYAGTLSATLVELDMSTGESVATLSIPETSFSFAINQPEQEQERHDTPLPTNIPGDLRKA